MRAQRMICHAVAVAALGTMGMAQSSMGRSGGMGQEGQQPMGQQRTIGQQNMGQPSDHTAAASMNPDHTFVMKAAQGGMAEVKLGNLAKKNGGSEAVKDFGNKMATDHSKANDELRQLAQKKGITLPGNVNAKDKRTSKMLAGKQGAGFDKAYIQDMVKDHEMDVAEFRKEAEQGKDPEVKAWAQKTLPVLEQHLAHAKEVAGQVGVDNTKKSAGAMSSHP